jgi:hypothetical protein
MTSKVVIDRPQAYWLPSRHHFAVARLIAFAFLGSARGTAKRPEHLALPIDRDQTAVEMHGVAAWVFVTTACYVAAALPVSLPLAIVLAVPLAAIAIHIPVVIGGLMLGGGNHIKSLSAGTMALLFVVSSYAGTRSSWVRFVAWIFFAILIINSAAAAVLWLLRGKIQAAEERCAG